MLSIIILFPSSLNFIGEEEEDEEDEEEDEEEEEGKITMLFEPS